MKKTFLILASILSFGVSQAQVGNTTFGAKAGLNISNANVKRSYDTDVSPRIGFYAGGFVNFKLTEKIALQPELLFSTQGFKEYLDDSGYIFDEEVKINYLNVPVNFQYLVDSKFHVEAGPQMNFLVSGKVDGKYYDPMFNESRLTNGVDIKEHLKSVIFGFNLGAGYAITPQLSISVRCHLGLSDAADLEGLEIKNQNIQVGLGYSFN